jgi:hypothetical protein
VFMLMLMLMLTSKSRPPQRPHASDIGARRGRDMQQYGFIRRRLVANRVSMAMTCSDSLRMKMVTVIERGEAVHYLSRE